MGFRLAVALMLVASAAAQTKPADGAKLLKELDAVAAQIETLQKSLVVLAQTSQTLRDRAAKGQAEESEALATALRDHVRALSVALAQHGSEIRRLHERSKGIVTDEILRPFALERRRIQAQRVALRPGVAAEELIAIEAALAKKAAAAAPGADEVLGLARFRLAMAWIDLADLEENAEAGWRLQLHVDASQKLLLAADAADSRDSGEGTSLRAAALRHLVEIEWGLYSAHAEAARQPGGSIYAAAAEKHKNNAKRAFERLQRDHREDTNVLGVPFIREAQPFVDRLK